MSVQRPRRDSVEPRLVPPRHARPAPLGWRDRATLALGLPLLSLGTLGVTTQVHSGDSVAVAPDQPPPDAAPDRAAAHPDRYGIRRPLP